MSYLAALRLHFGGRFQASPSTVNNDPAHFDNATFKKDYQKSPAGWWNPRGDGNFRLIGCKVTSAWSKGMAIAGDSILDCLIADSDLRSAGKMLDLDPEQQMVSQIWGLEVRICTPDGSTLLRGRFQPVGFTDIWNRAQGVAGGDNTAGAMYQSVLEDLEWEDISGSTFLKSLKEASSLTERLSIKFNVDGYNMNAGTPEFTRGRITGTIGPVSGEPGLTEPDHFVLGRHFMAAADPSAPSGFFFPLGRINFSCAVVDSTENAIYLDLGNALPTDTPGGALLDLGSLTLACMLPLDSQGIPVPPLLLGTIPYANPGWYDKTAGVVAIPIAADALEKVLHSPLVLLLPGSKYPTVAISEPSNGLYLRADQFVLRLNPGEVGQVQLYATRFGERLAGARVISVEDANELQPMSLIATAPPVATPRALEFKHTIVTNDDGVAVLKIMTKDPGMPRKFIDGQVYGVRSMLEDTVLPPVGYPFNQWEFISILLWSSFKIENPATWYGSIQPIFQQYANLYPVMDTFLDLGDYEAVCKNLKLLLLVFGLPVQDPNSMPVTRDLSAAKRKTILEWLSDTGADGKPLKGTAPPPLVEVLAQVMTEVPAKASAAQLEGKAIAASRRLKLTRHTLRKSGEIL